MTNRLRRAASRLSETRVGHLFARYVTVGWIVAVIAVLAICFALISYRISANFSADQKRADRADYIDCLARNDRRSDVKDIALRFVENDKFLIEFIDQSIPTGLPDEFKQPLFDRYAQQVQDIEDAYKPEVCSRPPGFEDELLATEP